MNAYPVGDPWKRFQRIWICFDQYGSVEVLAHDANEAREKAKKKRAKQGLNG